MDIGEVREATERLSVTNGWILSVTSRDVAFVELIPYDVSVTLRHQRIESDSSHRNVFPSI